MKNLPALAAALSALALTAGLPRLAEATVIDYQFDLIADISPVNTGTLLVTTSMNNSGTVAFVGTTAGGPAVGGGFGIFTGSGGALTTIAETGGAFSSLGRPSINDSGRVAFEAQFGPLDHGIFTGSGGALTTIADTSGPLDIVTGFGDPAINNGGTVAFTTNRNSAGAGIFSGSGGAVTTIADTSGALATTRLPSINDSGTVAFSASFDAGGQAIFTGTGGALTTIADTSGGFATTFLPSINDSGTVAFSATLDAGGSEIIASSGGVLTTLADTNGGFSALGSAAINNNGEVAFPAFLDTGTIGLFTGGDPVNDLVIQRLDPLFGSALLAIDFLPDFNDFGQISFGAVLADGRSVIVRATPRDAVVVAVPEPTSLALFALGLLGLTLLSGRDRRAANPGRSPRPRTGGQP